MTTVLKQPIPEIMCAGPISAVIEQMLPNYLTDCSTFFNDASSLHKPKKLNSAPFHLDIFVQFKYTRKNF